MKTSRPVAFSLALLAVAALALVGGRAFAEEEEAAEPKTLAMIVAADASLSEFVKGLKAADLLKTLEGAGPYTVLAPDNAAIASRSLPAETVPETFTPCKLRAM